MPPPAALRHTGGMVTNADTWRAAKLLVDRHGQDAPAAAERRAQALEAAGQGEGAAVFRQIARAARDLLAERPDGAAH